MHKFLAISILLLMVLVATVILSLAANGDLTVDAGTDQAVEPGTTVSLKGSASGNTTALTWTWDIYYYESIQVYRLHGRCVSFTANDTGQYVCLLTVLDDEGNRVRDRMTVYVGQFGGASITPAEDDDDKSLVQQINIMCFSGTMLYITIGICVVLIILLLFVFLKGNRRR